MSSSRTDPTGGARTIVVGVTGGIAAYKAVSVIRSLVLLGHDVSVIATEAALRFVGKPTLEAISRNPVNVDLYEGVSEVRHVSIGQSADVIVIAPATANTIAKLAAGIADDLLGNTVLASTAPVVLAPAMHTEMWGNAATVANVARLRERGMTIVGPGVGQLTGSDSGAGRMSEPDEIVAAVLLALAPRDLEGRRILVTAGGTREALDPVRFLGNRSSGRQGVALAAAAAARGATVTLIGANLEVAPPPGVQTVEVVSTADLAEAVNEQAPGHDTVIMTAAVADYRPRFVAEGKIKKEDQGESLTLDLVRNPDILSDLAASKRPDQIIVGFGAETESDDEALLALARAKIARKGSDYLVVNRVGWTSGFSLPDNDVVVVDSAGDIVKTAAGSKSTVAHRILDLLVRPTSQ
ncbi:bifunctional phosphopantothenoylcysteine decarboxylase/phosphopantothenate--cysteine ligase CoaBC [Marisediminicola sp. LYQ134]|uniref:bifunctional phosphopantothenoylcysteine decarboxylase/phosphopantothenate--cysteine ligase CoaBC n=1 Tax=Marisediminicola sp. LYQ134 TaxID=3391061 RepID=UPI003982E990